MGPGGFPYQADEREREIERVRGRRYRLRCRKEDETREKREKIAMPGVSHPGQGSQKQGKTESEK